MEYVFGSTLICANAETAKRVTFDPAVRLVSVTLEGDVYDPSGTLSGGSAPNSNGVLLTLQELNVALQNLDLETQHLLKLQSDLDGQKQLSDKTKQDRQKLDLKLHEIKLNEEQIRNNSASNVIFTNSTASVSPVADNLGADYQST